MGGTTRTRRSRPVTRDENAYFLLKKKVGKENFHKAPVRKVMQTRAAKKTFIRRALRASLSSLFTLHSSLSHKLSLSLISYLFISYLPAIYSRGIRPNSRLKALRKLE